MIFTSCDDSDNVLEETVSLELEADASLESNYEDVDQIVDAGLETFAESSDGRFNRREIIECAVISRDSINKTVTIDYGDGCDAEGRVIQGKVIVSYSNWRFVPGAFRTATFEDFYVDNVKVEGTRTLTNTSESSEVSPEFTITLDNGMLTFSDSTFASRESSRVRTWVRGVSPIKDEWHVNGSANGIRRDGLNYAVAVSETLVYSRECRRSGVFIPVQGEKVITFDGNTVNIDYGNGECDNDVIVTINDEEPFVQTVAPRRF